MPQHRVELLPDWEREQVLEGFNATATDYPREALIHELFEAQAAAHPDAEAVVYEDQRLSYGELNARANQVAHYLLSQGVKPDDRVAICVERSLELVVGLLGILKSGGAYVPLDPDYPPERLAYMLGDSAPVALLTQTKLAGILSTDDVPTLVLDEVEARAGLAAQPAHSPALRARCLTSRNLAYVIYTSGSTGTPKGVMNEHQGVVNRLLWAQGEYRIDVADRVLQKTPYSFDVSVWEFFLPLVAGAGLVLARPGGHRDPSYLLALIEAAGVTTMHFVPSMLAEFVSQVRNERCRSLRQVLCSGEALPHAMLQRASEALPQVAWHNLYGPTEAAIDVTAWRCRIGAYGEIVPIGQPIANTRIYVLDGDGTPVPIGVAGEIHIGGDGVARGYLNRPELTAERFLKDPFARNPDARMYRTGDLGRWLPDGNIEYLGRNDFQVKIRGFRIELGEIEAKLAACAGVREAVVLAREDVPGEKRLVAYLLAEAEAEPTASQLREALLKELPEYMVPGAFVELDAFPLTPNGKLDRKALPAPDGSSLVQREYEAPQGDVEETLARLWCELLGVERVGRHDHFFELGGHSLLVVTLADRLREAGLLMAVQTIFTAPSLCALAATLSRECADAESPVPENLISPNTTRITPALLPLVSLSQEEIDRIVASVSGGVANIQDIYPLLPMQEGLLFHHLLEEEGDTYLARDVLAFDERAMLDELLAGLQAMIDRHEVLRSAFYWEGLSQPVQIIRRQVQLSVVECRVEQGDDAEALLRERTDPGKTRLDLRHAPLLRVEIAHDRAHDRWVVVLLHHHITCDHLTMERMLAELAAWRVGRLDPAPAPAFREVVADAILTPREAYETFFRDLLLGLDAPSAPFGILNVQLQASELATASRPLTGELGAALRHAARQLQVPVSVLFHAAFALLVARCSGHDDVVFGTVLSGRLQGADRRGVALGLLINTLPFRLQLDDGDARSFVRRCHQLLMELLAHEQAPLTLAQRASGLPASMPLLTSLLNFRHSSAEAEAGLEWPGMRVLGTSGDGTNYPLTAKVDDFGTEFALTIDCHRDLAPQLLLDYLETSLATLCRAVFEPSVAVKSLDIMPPSERRALLGEDHVQAACAPGATLHELFEAVAARRPDAVALVFEGEQLSYRALDERANCLAHYLVARGVRPEARVAICLERGFAQVVSLLAVLKAGAAYVPLDAGHPDGRLRDTVANCDPSMLITSRALATRFSADSSLPVLCVDDGIVHDALARLPANAPTTTAAAHNLAYIIYTSGSTGLPKGVMVEHRQVLRLFTACNSLFDFGHQDVWTLFHSFAFDFSVWEIWGALLHGGRLVVVPQAVARSADAFGTLLEREQVTVLNQTPSAFWALLAAQGDHAGWSRSLRWVVFGGEALDPGRLRQWFAQDTSPVARLVNMYGITETTVHVTWQEIHAPMLAHTASPIGRPLPDLRVYLLDQERRPVPRGAIGEMYVAGAGLARGYWRQESLTAERFVPDPFAGGNNRMYKTGDLARLLSDGRLEYLGRNDFQVKIRGFRIELGEIEAKLAACAGVREAVVLAREDVAGDKRLVAYVVPVAGAAPTAAQLREALLKELPEYMVPGAFVELDAFPLTPNGKLDRKALPAPDGTSLMQREYEAPQGDIEETLGEIWKSLLGVERIGRHDHFFELGGHSLLVVRLLMRIQESFGVELPLQALFESPSLHQQADQIVQAELALYDEQAKSEISVALEDLTAEQLQQMLTDLEEEHEHT
ncbi:MAG: amino acid adenylation domain-containing protein [Lysobacter sp.]|nr:amino acid adenylation domain-containing protein [Lysobacter sp.]